MTTANGSALEGIKVIDLSRVLGGPYCTQALGDHGADVIKVEPPAGDETRGWGPPFVEGTASYFMGVNRNKRSVVLDLTIASDRDKLLYLLEDADVLVENFKPGTLERWDLGFATLSQKFPRLIHACVTGFGADGPLGGLPGYDAVVQAMSGMMSVNGEASAEPLRVGIPAVDMVTGLNLFAGVLLALQARTRTGRGQHVETALYDAALSFLHPHAANHFLSGKRPVRTGNAHPNISPYDLYRTGTRPIFLAIGNDRQFVRLCDLLGAPEIAAAPQFASNGERVVHRVALKEALEAVMADKDGPALAAALIAGGVPAGAVSSVDEALAHPHTAHRGMVIEGKGYRGVASPIKLSATPASYREVPPKLGADSSDIFKNSKFAN